MRTEESPGSVTLADIHRAAIRLISRQGFEAMSLRVLADEVGLQAGSLYHHIESKQDLLFSLLAGIMRDILAEYEEQVAPVKDPLERLRAFVRLHIDFHTRRKDEAFVGNTELRSLSPAHYRAVTGLRDQYEHHLTRIIQEGAAAGRFHVEDARVATYAVIALLTGVCTWYRPDERLSRERLTGIYTNLVLGALGGPLAAEGAQP